MMPTGAMAPCVSTGPTSELTWWVSGFSCRPVDVEPLNRLGQLRRRDREVLRGRGELSERRDLLLCRGRCLLGPLRGAVRDPRHFLHAPNDLADPPHLVLGVARERRGELYSGVQVREDGIERLLHRRRNRANALG